MAEATTTQEQSVIPDSGRYWEPIDNLNITYMERLAQRGEAGQTRDFMKEYKVSMLNTPFLTAQVIFRPITKDQ